MVIMIDKWLLTQDMPVPRSLARLARMLSSSTSRTFFHHRQRSIQQVSQRTSSTRKTSQSCRKRLIRSCKSTLCSTLSKSRASEKKISRMLSASSSHQTCKLSLTWILLKCQPKDDSRGAQVQLRDSLDSPQGSQTNWSPQAKGLSHPSSPSQLTSVALITEI